ncbi:hypothetical protein [Rhodococcus opacus]|uniref:hypothetical protein n=1 Tax=Rhodococcus opacus TaxID=37919 RepID=UPI00155AF13E|nr:hypothetical protein [Rhodococcus opacus]
MAAAPLETVCTASCRQVEEDVLGRIKTGVARFDDLVSGAALIIGSTIRELVAWKPDEVIAVFDLAQRLSEKGYWAFGFVAY